jgi:hypothetical protein
MITAVVAYLLNGINCADYVFLVHATVIVICESVRLETAHGSCVLTNLYKDRCNMYLM